MIPWREAWQEALYGTAGFYRRAEGPAGHFTTSTHGPLGPVFAAAILALSEREGLERIVDIGAGRGELLRQLHALTPSIPLLGVEVVGRPDDLPAGIDWLVAPGGALLPAGLTDLRSTLVVANEWLDVVPCTVARVTATGSVHEVLVDPRSGAEALGDPLSPPEAAWVAEHWPTEAMAVGDRLEIGLARDHAWADLVGRVRDGVVLAIDYGHVRAARPRGGTFMGYAKGLAVPPRADGSCDLTAHVAMDSLPGARLRSQREWVRDLLPATPLPVAGEARGDPAAYLGALARRGALTQLTDPGGLGAFLWATRHLP